MAQYIKVTSWTTLILVFILIIAVVNFFHGDISNIKPIEKISARLSSLSNQIIEELEESTRHDNTEINEPPPDPRYSNDINSIITDYETNITLNEFTDISTYNNTNTSIIDNENKYIYRIPSKKKGFRQDLRVTLPDFNYHIFHRPPGDSSDKVGYPRAYMKAYNQLDQLSYHQYIQGSLINHNNNNHNNNNNPLHQPQQQSYVKPSLEEVMLYIHHLPQCQTKPIFLTMATVGDDLYWQLIENYVYTMVKFNHIQCALVICVQDSKCMSLCEQNHFPCYDFQFAPTKLSPPLSTMEKIAEIKLLHVPKVLNAGVNVFMLDLDVGFLHDPMTMVDVFNQTPNIDIYVQEDMMYIMNRSKALWKTWIIEMLPNIGLFLCRGNNKTQHVFNMAWEKYEQVTDRRVKMNPGKDQNHVLDGMRYTRAHYGLRYAYFNNLTAILVDKFSYYNNRSIELGGTVAYNLLAHGKAIAAHMTCYEHSTKVLGMKATNAYWNPIYYDPLRPTITKQIIYINDEQVRDEIRSLIWLGKVTNRDIIIPNLLGPLSMKTGGWYEHHKYWPAYRTTKLMKDREEFKGLNIHILEPAFYWRVERDYDMPPSPHIYSYTYGQSLQSMRQELLSSKYASFSRMVIHPSSGRFKTTLSDIEQEKVTKWAMDSIGYYDDSYEKIKSTYKKLPSIKTVSGSDQYAYKILNSIRECHDIFGKPEGNRTCFNICK